MSAHYKAYITGYLVADYAFYPFSLVRGKGWKIAFEEAPESLVPPVSAFINDQEYPAKVLTIYATSLERAQYVADMVYASYCLLLGELPFEERPAVVSADVSCVANDLQAVEQRGFISPSVMTMRIPLACRIAAKASQKKSYQYALFKHLLSHEVYPTSITTMDPVEWESTKFVFRHAEYHVRCAYAIMLAYSVIEELSLEVRASKENPSMVKGKWNPKVKEDLETRLKGAGVDLSEAFLWVLRDAPTKIERKRAPRIVSRAEWAGLKIRDGEVALVDAIAYASWMRSRISAHRFGELAGSLNFYDVANVQNLARRLLLEVLGFWQYLNVKDNGMDEENFG